jgi:hypothetical protein
LEVGTHSHALDRQLLLTKQKELAAAISRGVSETYQARSPFNPNRALLAYTSVAVWQQPIAALTPIAWPQVKTTTLVDFVLGQEAELERSWLTALVTALSQEAAAADLAPTLLLAELLLNNNFYRLSNFSDLPAPLPRVPASLQGQKLYASALLAGGSHWRADLTDYVQQWQALLQPLASSFYQTTTVCPLNYFALAQNQRAQTQVSLKALAAAYPETTAHLQALSQLQSQIYYFALSQ